MRPKLQSRRGLLTNLAREPAGRPWSHPSRRVATPTSAKPRNLETSKPEPPASAWRPPTPAIVRAVSSPRHGRSASRASRRRNGRANPRVGGGTTSSAKTRWRRCARRDPRAAPSPLPRRCTVTPPPATVVPLVPAARWTTSPDGRRPIRCVRSLGARILHRPCCGCASRGADRAPSIRCCRARARRTAESLPERRRPLSNAILALLESALALKRFPGRSEAKPLAGLTAALVFQKPSLRTRVSFEVAMLELGGHAVYLSPAEIQLGQREGVADAARVLSRYVDVIVARVFLHADVAGLAEYATVPVINALSDSEHPCQILADLLTLYERRGALRGLRLAYVGDGNNVANSLALAASMLGIQLRFACPDGYEPDPGILERAAAAAADEGGDVELFRDPVQAVRGADAVYTDTWYSMGQESEADIRAPVFRRYQVNAELMSHAAPGAVAMHCLTSAPQPGDHRRGHRRTGVSRVRPGREPAPRAEGVAAQAPRSGRSSVDLAALDERLLALLQSVWSSLAGRFGLSAVLDIAIVTVVLYWLLSLIAGTSAATLVRGILILLTLGFVLSNVFNLTMLQFLLL